MDKTLTAGGQLPVIRIRNQHTHTLKDGWRLSESTVEITVPLHVPEPAETLSGLLAEAQRLAFYAGQQEALRRNQAGLEPGQ